MTLTSPQLLYLEFIRELPCASIYRITAETSDNPESCQIIVFQHEGCRINFVEPLWEYSEYLNSNYKWLRSILCTALKSGNRPGVSIPFTFPAEKYEMVIPEDALRVYSDGSCSINSNGGWASVIIRPGGNVLELSGMEEHTTGNRMELTAACMGLEKALALIPGSGTNAILLLTDSQYVIRGITHRLEVWSLNGFITAMGTPVTNKDIWEKISGIMKSTRIHCQWIKSGCSDPHHRRCDYLAGLQWRV
ncbi:MAG TPA: ribonuclease H [Spirochaetota bacterium]|nr:ribonuclease H [Spirochaetota bacterium]